MHPFQRIQHGIRDRWASYWFGRQGYLSVEVARMGLALAYLLSHLWHPFGAADAFFASHPESIYDPKGILLLWESPPSELLTTIIGQVAIWSPVFLLIGFQTRKAIWVVLLSNLFVRTLGESYYVVWSHGYNVIFLAHLAFLFAPVGQRWSVDAWWRQRKGKPMYIRNGYWAVLLAQWAVALMFVSAFYWKVLHKSAVFQFRWATTDSMRNHLVDRYMGCGDIMPSWLEWIANTPWAYQTMAWSNLAFQLLPILACVFVKKPKWRLFFGMAFVVEEIGLGVVMGLPDFHWLPLIVFFIDVDAFMGKDRALRLAQWRRATGRGFFQIVAQSKRRTALAGGFIVLFLFVYLSFSLNFSNVATGKTVFEWKAYPFAQFSMYSSVKTGLDGHPYRKPGLRFLLEGDLTEAERALWERKLRRSYYNNWVYNDSTSLHALAERAWQRLGGMAGGDLERVEAMNIERVMNEFQPPPRPAGLRAAEHGTMIRRSADGSTEWAAITFREEEGDGLWMKSDLPAGWEVKSVVAYPRDGHFGVALRVFDQGTPVRLPAAVYTFLVEAEYDGKSRRFLSEPRRVTQ